MRPLPLLLLTVTPVALPAADKVDFNRDVRPILSDNCFHCHGPDKAKRKADLRLDTDRTAAQVVVVPASRPRASWSSGSPPRTRTR